MTINQNVRFDSFVDFAQKAINNRVGTFVWKQEFVFDLSGDLPKITSARIGQTFDA